MGRDSIWEEVRGRVIEEMHRSSESDPGGSDTLAEVGDTELLARLRAGENAAFGELYRRHAGVVRRSAFRLVRDSADADDLTAEAFSRVLQAVRRGNGPREHARTYLVTVARRIWWEWSARSRDVPVDDEELSRRFGAEGDGTEGDGTARGIERGLIARAFSSLPERWRTVLWHVEVEGERPAVVAPRFGLSPNATAALARRAREGLRAAYLQAHLNEDRSPADCRSVVTRLGAYAAGNLRGAESARIRIHLRRCPSCTRLHDELRDVSSTLRARAGLPLPAIGAALAGHQLAGTSTVGAAAATAGKGLLLGMRIKLALTAGAVVAVSAFGVAGPFHADTGPALLGPTFDSDGGHSVVHNPALERVVETGDIAATSTLPAASPNADGSRTQAGASAKRRLDEAPDDRRSARKQQPHRGNGGCAGDCDGESEPAASADQAASAEAASSADDASGKAVARQLTIWQCAGARGSASASAERPHPQAGGRCTVVSADH